MCANRQTGILLPPSLAISEPIPGDRIHLAAIAMLENLRAWRRKVHARQIIVGASLLDTCSIER
jgi:hypothetical protein